MKHDIFGYFRPSVWTSACSLRHRPVILLCCLCCLAFSGPADLESVAAGLQSRYASVRTVTGNFQQTYCAPGVEQVESGVFWLKKPGLMRWEYLRPEEKLFVADGRKFYYYVPQDRQVQIQSFSPADLHNTPLEFLFGAGNIRKKFAVEWETEYRAKAENTYLIRLVSRGREAGYDFLVLEIDREAWNLKRILVRESGGITQEFLFTDITTNAKIDDGKFRFEPPEGIDVLKLDEE
jgi:outer membrane lipoprotein carrier protein